MTTQQTEDNYAIAREIFSQLQSSRVNSFPFFAYSGIKPSLFSEKALKLKLPKNPSEFRTIIVKVNVEDTYDIDFYNPKDLLNFKVTKSINGIYSDSLVEIIVREMGIN